MNDTSAPCRSAARTEEGGAAVEGPRHSAALHRAEALRLLGTVSLGRIVFTRDALPAIHPEALARYRRLLHPGWSRPDEHPRRGRPHEYVLRIRPDLVTGVRLMAAPDTTP